ncbi:MAG: hypothetical protein R3E31_22900 [Chloroflexota bacterium]
MYWCCVISEIELRLMQCDACLISMVHFPTRPRRVALLRELGLETISLDSIKDDSGRRLIENLRAVAWNGVKVATTIYPPPGFTNLQRPPIVTLLGVDVVVHVAQAAIRYGDDAVRREMAASGVPGCS